MNGSLANAGTVFAQGQINGPIFNTGNPATGGCSTSPAILQSTIPSPMTAGRV